jgi:hypothetical protein
MTQNQANLRLKVVINQQHNSCLNTTNEQHSNSTFSHLFHIQFGQSN